MMKLLTAGALALLSTAVGAYAETYNYLCKVDGKTLPLRVDDEKRTLEWKGKKYSLTEIECARAGWHAEGNGTSFDFCTATKGYGAIQKDGNVEVECDLKRR
jgi:hypothetical protein